jgi:hypothetical protein
MGTFVYSVRQADVTDCEPEPGWYIAQEEGAPIGPFASRLEALEAQAEGEQP